MLAGDICFTGFQLQVDPVFFTFWLAGHPFDSSPETHVLMCNRLPPGRHNRGFWVFQVSLRSQEVRPHCLYFLSHTGLWFLSPPVLKPQTCKNIKSLNRMLLDLVSQVWATLRWQAAQFGCHCLSQNCEVHWAAPEFCATSQCLFSCGSISFHLTRAYRLIIRISLSIS